MAANKRLKASIAAFEFTRASAHLCAATRAAQTVQRYLDTEVPDLWLDTMQLDGSFVVEPSPASSLYHLVGAITELQAALTRIRPSTQGSTANG